MNRTRQILASGLRLVALGALATTLLFSSSVQAAPAASEFVLPGGFWAQPSYQGDCGKRPPHTVCLGFSDGYTWLIAEPVIRWEQHTYQGKPVAVAVTPQHKYQHVLGTNLVHWVSTLP